MPTEDYLKGRGAQFNPDNRFQQAHYSQEHDEGLDELPPLPHRQLIREFPQTIVSRSNSPDIRHAYSINPYQGCEHGCVYCYARNAHEYWGFSAGLDFESKIMVKPDAPRLLEQHFQKRGWQAEAIVLSGNTDCYQPVERELKITRQLLQVFLKYGNPVGIITKNALVERDLDILRELAADQLVHVYFSINSLDDELRRTMEPRTASAPKRLAVMEQLSAAGVPCGVMVAPLIPGLNDHEVPQIIRRAADAGAQAAGYTVVRLNGAVGALFHDWLVKVYPDRAAKVWKQIQSLHGGQVNDSTWGRRMSGDGPVAESIRQLFRASRNKYLKGRAMPPYDLTKFRRNGNYWLF